LIKIYGASDDLIEIESDDQSKFQSEEFLTSSTKGNLIAVSDGTLFDIKFNRKGTWTIDVLFRGSAYYYTEHDTDSDTEIIMLQGYPKWIVLGKDMLFND
jgi:hypothetical protein